MHEVLRDPVVIVHRIEWHGLTNRIDDLALEREYRVIAFRWHLKPRHGRRRS